MKRLTCALTGLCLMLPLVHAQTLPESGPIAQSSPAPTVPPAPGIRVPAAPQTPAASTPLSELDGRLFYQLLVGEMSAGNGEAGAGISLILDAAKRTSDEQLFQRAADLALQSRSGELALQVTRAWKEARPTSLEASRYLLQILMALNRISETGEPLAGLLALTVDADKALALGAIPRAYARATDKKLAATVVEQALAPYLQAPRTASPAWTTVGRMRLAADDRAGALEAARRAQTADPSAEGPTLLALELMDAKRPQAEAMVKQYLGSGAAVAPEVRMAYVRNLLDAQRYPDASAQLRLITRDKPDFAEAWLVLGSLQVQDNQLDAAEASLQRFVSLALPQTGQRTQAGQTDRSRGLAQAFLLLSQVAEKRKDFTAAEAWLNRIENPELLLQAQSRRAILLARQGKVAEGRKLIRELPARDVDEVRARLLAEVNLLREIKDYKGAYELLGQAVADAPATETELLYEQAMMAEKLGSLDEMERLLRRAIERKPDYHHAYNALGYSLADRGVRLPEARELILKAVSYAPSDPFIQDSLGWVEFRLGNRTEALRILEVAYKSRPDPEISAHFGEVLWAAGQRERAVAIWKEGLLLNADNETLQATLKRLRVKL